MYRAIVRTFDGVSEIGEYHNARDAYYKGINSLKYWANECREKFVFLDLPELDLAGCAYKSETVSTWVIDRK